VLFDTGNGALPREYEQLSKRLPPGQTAARLAAAGYRPEDIDIIVITHGHPDHIGGLTEGGKPGFPKARYVFGAAAFDFWKRGENVRAARKFNRELFVKICVPWQTAPLSSSRAMKSSPASPQSMPPGTPPVCSRFISKAMANAS